jgi:hypothetical protein
MNNSTVLLAFGCFTRHPMIEALLYALTVIAKICGTVRPPTSGKTYLDSGTRHTEERRLTLTG